MSGRVMSLPYPFQLQMAKVEPRETVWKIARGLSSVHVDGSQGGEMAPLAPSRPLVGAQSGAYPEFPDSLWKGYSPKFATCKQRPSYGKDSHVAYVSPLASLL